MVVRQGRREGAPGEPEGGSVGDMAGAEGAGDGDGASEGEGVEVEVEGEVREDFRGRVALRRFSRCGFDNRFEFRAL